MRSDSYLAPETHSLEGVVPKPRDTAAVRSEAVKAVAERGEAGSRSGHRGLPQREPTLIAYGPVDVLGVRWAISSKMDAVGSLRRRRDHGTSPPLRSRRA